MLIVLFSIDQIGEVDLPICKRGHKASTGGGGEHKEDDERLWDSDLRLQRHYCLAILDLA